MKDPRLVYFKNLQKEIEKQFQQIFPDFQAPIEAWKGQTIRNFQAELQEKAGGYVSEKWFYTHIKKNDNEKLPRQDALDILAKYAGYEDWNHFLEKQQNNRPLQSPISENINHKARHQFKLVGAFIFLLIFVFISAQSLLPIDKEVNFQFCFIDEDTHEKIDAEDISIQILKENESPLNITCDSSACFQITANKKEKIRFIVNALYYKTDTITRILLEKKETIQLQVDDYALMIHYFSNANIEDWKKRRQQLDQMISNEAQIVQVSPFNMRGMEMYNKTEFIDKMTMPLESLKNVNVLETLYEEDKIIYLRFVCR